MRHSRPFNRPLLLHALSINNSTIDKEITMNTQNPSGQNNPNHSGNGNNNNNSNVTKLASETQGSAQDAAKKTADTARDTAKDMADGAEKAVKSTREMANDALDKAEDGVRRVKDEIDPMIDDMAAKAQEFAARSINYCAETSERARKQFNEAADATCRYVSDQPGKSMMLAAAAGAALAMALMLSRRSDK